jgi:hypothetical protein
MDRDATHHKGRLDVLGRHSAMTFKIDVQHRHEKNALLRKQQFREDRVDVMRRFAILIALMAISACTSAKHSPITQDELMRNTQEMFDSVAAGDQAPWKKYFAEDSMYFDEKGRSMDKAALVNDITPLRATPAASNW